MKKKYILTLIFSALTLALFSAQHIISNNGNTFTPAEISIHTGDTIIFDLGSPHDAIEVSFETYSSNGNTSNGGFEIPFGGGSKSFPVAGTYYFVCEPHAQFGMKGIIQVVSSTKINSVTSDFNFQVFPNPAKEFLSINYNLLQTENVKISIINLTGKEVIKLADEKLNAGDHIHTAQLIDKLTPGIYLIKLNVGEAVIVRKLMIN